MSNLVFAISTLALWVGAFFFITGSLGLVRFADLPSRLHAITKADTVGLMFIVMGLHLVWLGVLLPMQGFSAALWLGWVMLHHGCAKAALFLLAGEAQRSGWRRIMWVGWVPIFALIGLPWTSGGILKIELKAISQDQGLSWLFILISLSAIGTVWLMWHFWRLLRATVRPSQVQQQPTSILPWLVLSLLGLIWPWLWIQQANLSISALDQWHLTWPILMAIAIGVGVLRRRS